MASNKKKVQAVPKATWQDEVTFCGQRLSRIIEEQFQQEIKNGEAVLPKSSDLVSRDECAVDMLSIYFEYLFGTAVAISCHYATTEPQFEENMIALIRDKFSKVREMKQQGAFNGNDKSK